MIFKNKSNKGIEIEKNYGGIKEVGVREINTDGTFGIYQELTKQTQDGEDFYILEVNNNTDNKNYLLRDVATVKEAFIIDELQKYMDLSNPDNPKWVESVRLRLQDKEDWKNRVRQVLRKYLVSEYEDQSVELAEYRDILKELGLNDN